MLIKSVTVFIGAFVAVNSIRIPENPCPEICTYRQENGIYHGEITVPYNGQNVLELQVNVSLAVYDKFAKLKLELITPRENLPSEKLVQYKVVFPSQLVLPKITQVRFNGKVLCSGPEEPLIPGTSGTTSLWARTTYMNAVLPLTSSTVIYKDITNKGTTPVPALTVQEPSSNLNPAILKSNPFFVPKPSVPKIENKNQNFECGVTNNLQTLVVNGEESPEGQYPWLVAMMSFDKDKNSYSYRCTANLVSDKHVITAAHCIRFHQVQVVPNEDILFILGKSNISRWSDAEIRGVEKIQVHSDYKYGTGHADIAVITLKSPVAFKKNIRPICLWSGDSNLDKVVNQMGLIAGWGKDENGATLSIPVVKQTKMPIVSQETCLRSNQGFQKLTSEKTFCAGSLNGSGPCTGDSGAGFMMLKNGKYELRGVVSLSLSDKGNCDLSNYIVFGDVAKFKDFVNSCIN